VSKDGLGVAGRDVQVLKKRGDYVLSQMRRKDRTNPAESLEQMRPTLGRAGPWLQRH
jgi:hypothetical protein